MGAYVTLAGGGRMGGGDPPKFERCASRRQARHQASGPVCCSFPLVGPERFVFQHDAEMAARELRRISCGPPASLVCDRHPYAAIVTSARAERQSGGYRPSCYIRNYNTNTRFRPYIGSEYPDFPAAASCADSTPLSPPPQRASNLPCKAV